MKPEQDPLQALFDAFRAEMEPIDPEGKEEAITQFLRATGLVRNDERTIPVTDMAEDEIVRRPAEKVKMEIAPRLSEINRRYDEDRRLPDLEKLWEDDATPRSPEEDYIKRREREEKLRNWWKPGQNQDAKAEGNFAKERRLNHRWNTDDLPDRWDSEHDSQRDHRTVSPSDRRERPAAETSNIPEDNSHKKPSE